MTTVAGLFDSQKNAQKAIEALVEKPFADDIEFSVIEDADEMVREGAFPGGSGTVALSPPVTVVRGKIASLDVEDSAQVFLRRGVQRGGVVVAVECDHEYTDEVEETMREFDAQFEKVD